MVAGDAGRGQEVGVPEAPGPACPGRGVPICTHAADPPGQGREAGPGVGAVTGVAWVGGFLVARRRPRAYWGALRSREEPAPAGLPRGLKLMAGAGVGWGHLCVWGRIAGVLSPGCGGPDAWSSLRGVCVGVAWDRHAGAVCALAHGH